MSRILLGWELGLHLGHLARLLPLAMRLKSAGHSVLAVVRNIESAAGIFSAAGVPFVQAPCTMRERRLPDPPGSYADILLMQGWAERENLSGLVQGWLNLFRQFRPELVLVDHSPTALLAARVAGIARAQIGNGFELPPLGRPLPPFPGLPWASAERAAESERRVLDSVNSVMRAHRATELDGLQDLFDFEGRLFATFAQLDHYGARPDTRYLGPIQAALKGTPVDWPGTMGFCVFAYLRPDIDDAGIILAGLALSHANVICMAPGFSVDQLQPYRSSRICFVSQPVDLQPLVTTADACFYYGAGGTVARFLLAGVPQLLRPNFAEGYLAARRIEELGAGIVLRGALHPEAVALALDRLIGDMHFKSQAQKFADAHRDFNPDKAIDAAMDALDSVLSAAMQESSGAPCESSIGTESGDAQ